MTDTRLLFSMKRTFGGTKYEYNDQIPNHIKHEN